MTVLPELWEDAVVSSKTKLSRFISSKEDDIPTLYPEIPLKPRIHPVKDVDVIPVYDIISSSIFKIPYSDGKPLVLGTEITVSSIETSDKILVDPVTTSGTKLSDFIYWSKFDIKSLGPPWNSCEI